MDQIAPTIPVEGGWIIQSNWHTISTDFDPDGWQYATSFESPYWFPKAESTCKNLFPVFITIIVYLYLTFPIYAMVRCCSKENMAP